VAKTVQIEGVTVGVGDWVGFKSDVEQGGRVKAVRGQQLLLENPDGFEGGYIGGQTEHYEDIDRCWVD